MEKYYAELFVEKQFYSSHPTKFAPTHYSVVIFIVIIVLVAVSTYIEWKMMMTYFVWV